MENFEHMIRGVKHWEVSLNNVHDPYLIKEGTILRTTNIEFEEDWKAIRPPIPAGEEVVVQEVFRNCYGTFVGCYYNGQYYNIAPKVLEYIKL